MPRRVERLQSDESALHGRACGTGPGGPAGNRGTDDGDRIGHRPSLLRVPGARDRTRGRPDAPTRPLDRPEASNFRPCRAILTRPERRHRSPGGPPRWVGGRSRTDPRRQIAPGTGIKGWNRSRARPVEPSDILRQERAGQTVASATPRNPPWVRTKSGRHHRPVRQPRRNPAALSNQRPRVGSLQHSRPDHGRDRLLVRQDWARLPHTCGRGTDRRACAPHERGRHTT